MLQKMLQEEWDLQCKESGLYPIISLTNKPAAVNKAPCLDDRRHNLGLTERQIAFLLRHNEWSLHILSVMCDMLLLLVKKGEQ